MSSSYAYVFDAPGADQLRAVGVDDLLMLQYHDREWGVPVHDDRKHFEFPVLEGAQAGLSWTIVLKKREGYGRAIEGFDPQRVARFFARRIEKLALNSGIIRNRMKIEAGRGIKRLMRYLRKHAYAVTPIFWQLLDSYHYSCLHRHPIDIPSCATGFSLNWFRTSSAVIHAWQFVYWKTGHSV